MFSLVFKNVVYCLKEQNRFCFPCLKKCGSMIRRRAEILWHSRKDLWMTSLTRFNDNTNNAYFAKRADLFAFSMKPFWCFSVNFTKIEGEQNCRRKSIFRRIIFPVKIYGNYKDILRYFIALVQIISVKTTEIFYDIFFLFTAVYLVYSRKSPFLDRKSKKKCLLILTWINFIKPLQLYILAIVAW